ncbi:unnamed protein product [Rotaria sordida]|uniref:Uncharacterized protein n=1 Tax=Rotaria sordida TaxID=392033 RepID=A0A818ZW72_9BILA|nr:unnamed protein product [Rotaria sordida]CAF1049826.1 unnamed protein product [Rotaria sordida]CAF1187347.1 unnamed protein product [Rotaria sordida]CAF3692402.1 unnamed protein product [Rotaria sordida]CAF3754809.1 unnamed protein product [Rotaria sordida]
MITHRRQDLTNISFGSTCTTPTTTNLRWSDVSSNSSFCLTPLSFQRPMLKCSHRCIISSIPPAWSPILPISQKTTTLRDFCLPRQEPRPPIDIFNRSSLYSCSPSLVKFSRTNIKERESISTSTTTLPSTNHTDIFLHSTSNFLTVNGPNTHPHLRRHTR